MPRKKSLEDFIADAQKVHGDKYDYSLAKYENNKVKVLIRCPLHGVFAMTPNNHTRGQGCPKCGDSLMASQRRSNVKSFIDRARVIHGEKYDYSKVDYVSLRTKVVILCPKHGEFYQRPSDHIRGAGCPLCARELLAAKFKTSLVDFKKAATEKHNSKYDYSLVKYSSLKDKIKIICPIHGEFIQEAHSHMKGCGCPQCYGNKRSSTAEFIRKAQNIHGDRYDYSLVDYHNSYIKIRIGCALHGWFDQKPQDHLAGYGCPICGGSQKMSNDDFIKRAKIVHKNKYDYSLVKYENVHTKVQIICPHHGLFMQTPYLHLSGSGCTKCAGNYKPTTAEFIDMAKKIHGEKYDYSKVNYKSADSKVVIICPEHGEFYQTPRDHIRNRRGCVICSQPLRGLTTERFQILAKEVHGDRYDYSKVEYRDLTNPVTIICPKHGEFLQSARVHIWHKAGCPICSSSHLEADMRQWLISIGVIFEEQKQFKWLSNRRNLKLDFFLPEYNVAIECQGYQHFKPVSRFGGEKSYIITKRRDDLKRQLCHDNGVRILYYSNLGIDYPYKVFEDKDDLLKEIMNTTNK